MFAGVAYKSLEKVEQYIAKPVIPDDSYCIPIANSGAERMPAADLYATVTNQIVAMLEKGVVPWRSPILGQRAAGHPKNLNTGKPYRGVNVFLLALNAYAKGYGSAYWLTFNQAEERGGTVKRGERASLVVFWKQLNVKDRHTGEPATVPMLRHYNVFNVEQCEGIESPDATPFAPTDFNPIEAAAQIATGFTDGPAVEHGGQKAFYRPATDVVQTPEPSRFTSSEEFYSTLFHELSHSTGHATRLNRKLGTAVAAFGSPDYCREELVAEMSAAFLCGHAGITPAVIGNQAAYLAGWIKQLREDSRMIVTAAGAGQRATDWILGQREKWGEQ
jgi:antirestriction protein ArdC